MQHDPRLHTLATDTDQLLRTINQRIARHTLNTYLDADPDNATILLWITEHILENPGSDYQLIHTGDLAEMRLQDHAAGRRKALEHACR